MMRDGRLARLGMLSSLALILFVVESLVPKPLPWMKLGLGNVAVLLALLLLGAAPAAAVCVIKLGVGGLVSGGFGNPAFIIGACAGLVSLAAMATAQRVLPGVFSIVGVSILGAVAHQLSQLALAATYIGHQGLFSLLPLFLLTGLISGALTGVLAHLTCQKLVALGWQARGPACGGRSR